MSKPCFDNILRVLDRKAPKRPTLFEFFMNQPLYKRVIGNNLPPENDPNCNLRIQARAFFKMGYDYASLHASEFGFPGGEHHREKSRSLNEGATITDRKSFNAYKWMDPDKCDYSRLDKMADELPEGGKFMVYGPGGVLENVIGLTGFDNLCFILADDPKLAKDLFDAVGSRLVRYYEIAVQYKSAGFLMSNDDWGFKTQTMISPADLRKYCFPWHKKIVEVGHKAGKPVALHSCGYSKEIMDDVINDMKYDGKHSQEDTIQPIEEAYEQYGKRICLLGGIDVDFVCRSTIPQIKERAKKMLERSAKRGSFALGTGNSVPEYVPQDNFLALISTATDGRKD